MKKDEILPPSEVSFLQWLYSKQRARLEDEEFTPKLGVPQGGINSPILFNFTLYYVLLKVKSRVNKWIDKKFKMFPPEYVKNLRLDVHNLFAFADDLALLLSGVKVYSIFPRCVTTIIRILNEESSKWGLFINWDKSAVQPVGHCKVDQKNVFEGVYKSLKSKEGKKDKKVLTHIKLHSYMDDKNVSFQLPVEKVYKYLGVQVTGTLKFGAQRKFLRQKIGIYLTHSHL